MSELSKALSIVAKAFEGKYDKGGKPYFIHCYHVMNKLKYEANEQVLCAAVMHDLIEDTFWTRELLEKEGFSKVTLDILDAVTHRKDESYDDYINRVINAGYWACRIKLEDLRHNSDLRRIKGRRDKDFERVKKYQASYLKIMDSMDSYA